MHKSGILTIAEEVFGEVNACFTDLFGDIVCDIGVMLEILILIFEISDQNA